MKQITTPEFEIDLIDFTQKRLNLNHDPKTSSTIKVRSSFNAFGKAIVKLRKSFIPDQIQR